MSTIPHVRILDYHGERQKQSYTYERTMRIDDTYTVRVRFKVDSYKPQSYGVAEVLSTDLTWTTLASSIDWYDDVATPSKRDLIPGIELETPAATMTQRAAAILRG